MFRIHDLDMLDMFDQDHISEIFTRVMKRIMAEREHDGASYALVRKSIFDIVMHINEASFELIEDSARDMAKNIAY